MRALSCVWLLISTGPRQAEEGKRKLIRLQSLWHTSHGETGEKLVPSPTKLSPSPSSPSPHQVLFNRSVPHLPPPLHTRILGPTILLSNLGLSFCVLFVLLAFSFVFVDVDCFSGTRGQDRSSKPEPFTFMIPFFPSS